MCIRDRFQWAFSAAAATIVSGSVAERTAFQAYLGYSFFLTAFVYPVVVHWVWDSNGWLTAFKPTDKLFDCGMYDFAGSGVVHMTGGVAGLMGAMIVGPRTGRFGPDGRVVAMPGHNASLVVLGTFILWVGWYGFNPGSQLAIIGSEAVVARTAVSTTLSAAAGGVTAMAINYGLYHVWDLIAVCNGVLAGLVGITAGCSVTEPWTAIVCGFISAWVIHGAGKLLLKLKIDDPLEAAPMHSCMPLHFANEGNAPKGVLIAKSMDFFEGGWGRTLVHSVPGDLDFHRGRIEALQRPYRGSIDA